MVQVDVAVARVDVFDFGRAGGAEGKEADDEFHHPSVVVPGSGLHFDGAVFVGVIRPFVFGAQVRVRWCVFTVGGFQF